MIKTTYQTPELRDSNDNVVQEGSFGKNTALANSTNDGWIDYVMNDLEALHDTIGDSAPTLDGNGHVVEPANLAIGDEDGNRIKNSYLKLSGGNVTGIASFRTDLRMLDNQDNRFGGLYVPASSATEQYMQLYGGTRATGDARLTLYPSGDGHFQLLAYSNDGATSYALQSDNAGNLNWRGYPLAWKKDYLPLAGGTMTGNITLASGTAPNIRTDSNTKYLRLMNDDYNGGASLYLYGSNNTINKGGFILNAYDGTNRLELRGTPSGALTWNNNTIALAKDYLPLGGGTMTGNVSSSVTDWRITKSNENGSSSIYGGVSWSTSASLQLCGNNHTSLPGGFNLSANNGTTRKELVGKPDGTLTWGGNDITPQILTSLNPEDVDVPNNAVTTLTTFTLTKGTWLVHLDANFQSNATGYRRIGVATSGTTIGMGRHWYASQQAVNGISTVMSLTTFITTTVASQTYYFNAQQTSGTQLTVGNGVQAFRVSPIV